MQSFLMVGVGLGLALVGATAIAFADEVDWKSHGFATAENTPEICFFDAKSVVHEGGGQVRVWTKCLVQIEWESIELDKTGVEKAAGKIGDGYVPPIVRIGVMKYDQIVEVVAFEEIANLSNIEPKARILDE